LAGIACVSAGGIATVVAERNEIVGNGTGLMSAFGCTFKSMGNNAVEDNGVDVDGTITSGTLR
jgi:hypothetical protein